MIKKIPRIFIVLIALIVLYFVIWPLPIEPIAWQAPPDPGYNGVHAVNQRLKEIETLSIGKNHGPEDVALDGQGRIYTGTSLGYIVRLQPDGSQPENWVNTEGGPFGSIFTSVLGRLPKLKADL